MFLEKAPRPPFYSEMPMKGLFSQIFFDPLAYIYIYINMQIFQQDFYIWASLSESHPAVDGPGHNIVAFTFKTLACFYGVEGTRNLSGCQGNSSLKKFGKQFSFKWKRSLGADFIFSRQLCQGASQFKNYYHSCTTQ